MVGLSFRTAPLAVREALALTEDQQPQVLKGLLALPHVGEAMVLSTCNRVELIVGPRGGPEAASLAAEELTRFVQELAKDMAVPNITPYLSRRAGAEAVLHVLRVAASLDSLVVGEPQILGQTKEAFEFARSQGTLGPLLTRVLEQAFHASKRVRTETSIGQGLVSVSSVAVELARQIFGSLERRRALLIGAGEMGESAATSLVNAGARVSVVNRSFERAAALAERLKAQPLAWEELPHALAEADVVLSSTSSRGYILTRPMVERAMKQRRGRELFLIDIAVPRDIDPAVQALDGVFLHNVDDLEAEVQASRTARASEAEKAERILLEEARAMESWVETRSVAPTIVALRSRTRALLQAELERSLSGKLKHLVESDRKALEVMLDAATNKLLHAPTQRLKQLASEPQGELLARQVRELFELPEVAVVSEPPRAPPASEPSRPSVLVPSENRAHGSFPPGG